MTGTCGGSQTLTGRPASLTTCGRVPRERRQAAFHIPDATPATTVVTYRRVSSPVTSGSTDAPRRLRGHLSAQCEEKRRAETSVRPRLRRLAPPRDGYCLCKSTNCQPSRWRAPRPPRSAQPAVFGNESPAQGFARSFSSTRCERESAGIQMCEYRPSSVFKHPIWQVNSILPMASFHRHR